MVSNIVILVSAMLFLATSLVSGTARIDCGGQGGRFGAPYEADRLYSTTNGSGAIGGTAATPFIATNGQVIENTDYQLLFNSIREGVTEYRFDVPNGLYLVTLQFLEILQNGPNLRKFSVLAEGTPLLSGLDIYALYGRNYAITYQFAVTVADGQMNITFPATIGQSTISGISVQNVFRNNLPPGMPGPVSGLGGYYRNIITWPDRREVDLAGYVVARSAAPGGPYTPLTAVPTPVSRYFDDVVAPAVTAYYIVAAVDVFGNQSGYSPPVAASPRDRTKSALPVYQLTLAPDQYAILHSNPDADYVSATFADGNMVFPDIGAKYRGTTSLKNQKKSWKLNFKKSLPFQGRDKLNQKASSIDTTLLTECLSSAQLAGGSALAGTCGLSHLEVNGEYLGVFSRIDEVDDDFFIARGVAPQGQLIEAQDPEYANFRVLEDYSIGWDDHSENEDGYPALAQLIQTINTTSDADFPGVVSSLVNVDSYLDYLSSMAVNGDWDHISHNYYVYRSPDSPIWEVVPKDFDQAFALPSISLLHGAKGGPFAPVTSYNVLTQRLLAVPRFRQWYANKLAALLAAQFTPAVLSARINNFHNTISEDAHRDVYKRFREINEPFDQSPGDLQAFVSQRIAYIDANLSDISPGLSQPVVINEVLADNRTGITTQAGVHSPWLELYNPSGQPYNLTGHYLTNNPSLPALWKFPDGTTIPAGGYLLIWLDNQAAAGELHASFTINPKGQALALYAPSGRGNTILDTIAYRAQKPDVSYGRRSSGSALWAPQSVPTPLGANLTPP